MLYIKGGRESVRENSEALMMVVVVVDRRQQVNVGCRPVEPVSEQRGPTKWSTHSYDDLTG